MIQAVKPPFDKDELLAMEKDFAERLKKLFGSDDIKFIIVAVGPEEPPSGRRPMAVMSGTVGMEESVKLLGFAAVGMLQGKMTELKPETKH